jgi:hypothetical protein
MRAMPNNDKLMLYSELNKLNKKEPIIHFLNNAKDIKSEWPRDLADRRND